MKGGMLPDDFPGPGVSRTNQNTKVRCIKKGGLKMASNIEIIRKQREVLPAESRHTVLKLLPPHLC